MRFSSKALATGAILAAVGCQAGAGTASLETDDQKASYAIGLNIGGSLDEISGFVDMAALRKGIDDAMTGADPALSPEDIQMVMQEFQGRVTAALEAETAELAAANEAAGEAFMAENGQRDGVETTDSGLQYEVLRPGEGATPGGTEMVTIHYKGTLADGTQFDSSYDRGTPATFAVNGVIPGFSEGLQLMQPGSQYRFYIPGNLAYGMQGSEPMIEPMATLVFEVEMIEIGQ